jgi:hypothetical protein
MQPPRAQGQITSAVPGRVRLRLPPPHRHALPELGAHLGRQPGIHQVAVNGVTGSVLIHCDRHRMSTGDIAAMCRDIGVVVGELIPAVGELAPVAELVGSDAGLPEALDDVDRRLGRDFPRQTGLRLLVPLILGSLGVRQLIVDGLGQLSGYLLILVAIDAFVRILRRRRRAKPLKGKPTTPWPELRAATSGT